MSDLTLQGAQGAGPAWKFPETGKKPAGTGFGEILKKTVETMSSRAAAADEAARGLVSGEHANIHETLIAMEEANITFRLITRAQNKLLTAYQEITRIQL